MYAPDGSPTYLVIFDFVSIPKHARDLPIVSESRVCVRFIVVGKLSNFQVPHFP
jgi:hypothetical protein